jgi:hypothetical protein
MTPTQAPAGKPRVPWFILAASLIGFISQPLRAQDFNACAPPPQVKAALDQLRSIARPDQTGKEFSEERRAQIQALAGQFPHDFFVDRASIDFQPGTLERTKLIEQYKALHEQSPDSAPLAYLYGLTLVERRTPEAIKLFDASLEEAPQFPWPHLALANIYTSPVFSQKEKAVSHMKAFLGLCPSTLEGYDVLTRVDDKELARQGAAKLRELLQTRSDAEALGAYPTLWSLEFKAHPPSEYDPLRKQVAEDLKRIRALNVNKREWYQALEEGYKLVNDQKQSDWAKEERESRFPQWWELAASEKWWKDNKWPKPEDPPERRHEFFSALLKESAEWVKARPNATFMWTERLDAMTHLEDVPIAEVEATADSALKTEERNAGPEGPESGVFFEVAEAFSKKQIHPERVVELARKGLEQLEVESKQPPHDLYATKDMTEWRNFNRASERFRGVALETDGYVRLGQAEKAQQELAQLEPRLNELKSLAGDKDDRKKDCAGMEASYWGLAARLAELQNRKLDAMAFYENALLTRLQAGIRPEAGEKDEIAEGAQKLWASLGGTDEGWKTWYGRPAAELAAKSQLTWERANEPLPSFELADVQGKTWRLADVKGKVVLLNVWASW